MVRRFPKRIVVLAILLAVIVSNLLAYKHAYAMLHFSQRGERTSKPEELSILQRIWVLFTGVNIPRPTNDTTPNDYGLTYETHTFKVDDETELEAWYIPHPESAGLILMFHGYASAKSSLLPEAQAFNQMGYATFLVDFRGSGNSNQSETSIGYYEADDVAAAVNYVQSKIEPKAIILYGQSMGGVAILRAIAENEVKPQGVIVEAVFDKMVSTVANRFASMGIPAFPGTQMLIFWGSLIEGYWGFQHNPIDYAQKVDCPVLMLHGTDDERATLEQAQAVFEQFKGKKEFEEFIGVGHESYFVARPSQWKEVVGQVLAQ
ncbi:MAG: 2-succinyl-6-hydroxy-2,4-cyclohexadiene-1-carboxylate synthase [Anaerolineae bacterium]|nr:2-succinyl-6-hydroxy-2,4-cyclohexadiene-1-carboxylate synthase [Anaerolineae bacterium]